MTFVRTLLRCSVATTVAVTLLSTCALTASAQKKKAPEVKTEAQVEHAVGKLDLQVARLQGGIRFERRA